MLSILHVSSQRREMTVAEHSQGGPDLDSSASREVSRTTLRAGITLLRFYFSNKDPKNTISTTPMLS